MTDDPLYSKLGFTDAEWGLLVGLPQSVLTAASAATPDSARKTRAETEAGIAKIADARVSASPLVVALAVAAVSRAGDPELGEQAPVIEPSDPVAYAGDVLNRAVEANALLAAKAGPADAETYKHWLVGIAESVVGAPPAGASHGVGPGVQPVTDPEREFRDALAKALAD